MWFVWLLGAAGANCDATCAAARPGGLVCAAGPSDRYNWSGWPRTATALQAVVGSMSGEKPNCSFYGVRGDIAEVPVRSQDVNSGQAGCYARDTPLSPNAAAST